MDCWTHPLSPDLCVWFVCIWKPSRGLSLVAEVMWPFSDANLTFMRILKICLIFFKHKNSDDDVDDNNNDNSLYLLKTPKLTSCRHLRSIQTFWWSTQIMEDPCSLLCFLLKSRWGTGGHELGSELRVTMDPTKERFSSRWYLSHTHSFPFQPK